MNSQDFDQIVTDRCDKIKQTLSIKAKEYVRGDDRLHNFNRGAAIAGISREKVLKGFLLKHEISLLDILDDVDKGYLPSEELINEKIGDIINYYILLEVSIRERINTGK